ncbi:MAG: 2-oxo-4-hydroxy-4-carboxy-5-ureidoimidazoline decarboxylase [Woeseiaceae bacterium]|nr:2-oxo-4-hydroxy-4-carboxy-5-ureidoimidazoline decarboxylase [Woeseiaceae bacterium]MDX2607706.1 2-oxo-4-hydroxy-4-carboxy-5-ureidoimidazoline decarboxylase [Woeseiaceae bacterium]
MTMAESDFVSRFGGIYELSPWVAEEAASVTTEIDDIEKLAELMADCVDNASTSKQLELIRAHPDLAGKAQVAGELTEASTSEQTSAGLDQCSLEEYERFQTLNTAYHEKFGFPFVMAVKDSSREEILGAFSDRLENDPATEFETALAEIHQIARLRLRSMEVG